MWGSGVRVAGGAVRLWLAAVMCVSLLRPLRAADEPGGAPPNTFLVVVDVSPSMLNSMPAPVQPNLSRATRLQEVQQRLATLVDFLPDGVRVIVTQFDTEERQLGDLTLSSPAEREKLKQAFLSLTNRNNGTYLWRTAKSQLTLASKLAAAAPESRVRMLLYTDGEDNENAPGLNHESIIREFGDRITNHIQWDWVTLGYDLKPVEKQALSNAGVNITKALDPAEIIPVIAGFRLSAVEQTAGQSITLFNESVGINLKSSVDWGDGSEAVTAAPFTKSYQKPGRYKVVLTVSDARQRTSQRQEVVTITAPAAIPARIRLDRQQVPWGQPVKVTDDSPPGVQQRKWLVNGRPWNGSERELSVTLNTPGRHIVRLEVTDAFAQTTEAMAEFEMLPQTLAKPVIQLSAEKPQIGQPLSATSAAPAARKWQWQLDGKSAGNTVVIELPTSIPGTHRVELSVADEFGQTATATASYTVILPEAPQAAFSVPEGPLQPGARLTLINDSVHAGKFTWKVPGLAPIHEKHLKLTLPDYGKSVSVTLEVTDSYGRTDSLTRELTVPLPLAPVAGIIGPDAVNPREVCVLMDNSSGMISSRVWEINGQPVEGGNVLEQRFDTPGEFRVTRRVSGPGGTDELTTTILVNAWEKPVAKLSFGTAAPRTGDQLAVTNLSTGPIERVVVELLTFSESTEIAANVLADTADTPDALPLVLGCPNAGEFAIRLTAHGPGGSDVTEHLFTVVERYAPVTAGIIASTSSGTASLDVQFELRSSGTVSRRVFDPGDGSAAVDVTEQPSITHRYEKVGTWTAVIKVFGVDDFAPASASAGVTVVAPAPPWVRALVWQLPLGGLGLFRVARMIRRNRKKRAQLEAMLVNGELIIQDRTRPMSVQRHAFSGTGTEEQVDVNENTILTISSRQADPQPEIRAYLLVDGHSSGEVLLVPDKATGLGDLELTWYPSVN